MRLLPRVLLAAIGLQAAVAPRVRDWVAEAMKE